MELISRQYKVSNRNERIKKQEGCKQNIDSYITRIAGHMNQGEMEMIRQTLEELFLEDIGAEYAQIWINRINNNETSLEEFKRLYLLMANYGFRPYHT
jgi:hypothetical protein